MNESSQALGFVLTHYEATAPRVPLDDVGRTKGIPRPRPVRVATSSEGIRPPVREYDL